MNIQIYSVCFWILRDRVQIVENDVGLGASLSWEDSRPFDRLDLEMNDFEHLDHWMGCEKQVQNAQPNKDIRRMINSNPF